MSYIITLHYLINLNSRKYQLNDSLLFYKSYINLNNFLINISSFILKLFFQFKNNIN